MHGKISEMRECATELHQAYMTAVAKPDVVDKAEYVAVQKDTKEIDDAIKHLDTKMKDFNRVHGTQIAHVVESLK